ncbi:hypothetical protein [Larkinella terrae]|uniref:Uncharacterized protein n=1 Tax=Larkinella terrae TaxID=2025311 RepID=A0A7K0EVY4_9BACT|nr:hypothetical protein [Larkinella terrae]MRS65651.1 hypothetical protein [Larkinella terrae]
MLTTATIIETFQNLPPKISLDEAVERLIILDRYEKAMEEIEDNKGYKHEDVIREARQWIQEQK